MAAIDHLMLSMDQPGPPPIITGFLEFERPLDFKRLEAAVQDRLLRHERFKQRVYRPAGPVETARWETDANFDLKAHLFVAPAPYPGNKEQLQALFSSLASKPLDPERPLWQIYYIKNIESGGSLLFFRVHHCIADGISLVRLLVSITDEDPGVRVDGSTAAPRKHAGTAFPRPPQCGKKLCNAGDFAIRGFKNVLSNPCYTKKRVKTAGQAFSEGAGTIARVLMLPPDSRFFFKGERGHKRSIAWSEPLPLADVKKAATHFNATVNDIVVALATGGLRRYLGQHEDLDGKPGIRMGIPVSLRPPGSGRGDHVALENRIGFLLAELPVYIRNPGRRIRRVRNMLNRLKQSSDMVFAWAGLHALGSVPPDMARKTAYHLAGKITGIISNVPGPGRSLCFAGEKLKKTMFWLPLLKGLSLGISIISYNNAVFMGIVTDSRIVPDPETISRHIEDEFKALLAQCGSETE